MKALWLKVACTVALVAMFLIFASSSSVQHVKAQPDGDDGNSRVRIGLSAAPVPLNLKGKNIALVGLGSYYVNVVGDCDGCHSAGPQTEFAKGGNPFFNQPKMINADTYLGGGRDFGALIPGSAHIISRNLTPDSTGRPEGGNTFKQFLTEIRTGTDLDHRHPPCAKGTINSNCIPAPFDGNLLQIMPWFNLKDLSDHDLRAIYEYLSAVPCIQGNDPAEPAHRCG